MALYPRILVPLDGTAVDDALLDHVAQLAQLTGAEVVLLRVAHYHTRDTMAHEVEDAEELLARGGGELSADGVKVRTVVGRGEPADVDRRAGGRAAAPTSSPWPRTGTAGGPHCPGQRGRGRAPPHDRAAAPGEGSPRGAGRGDRRDA